ncbi:ADL384Wp [Eremothecium gossypii ATCC 10895]|uniref:Branched-chain-amino-acid aminotransferase n=1 Tax=Eremothecium gossypii (strain ATCC 10895 / CBS 109.51 / FGSC 9923 / NRRL Y-1056) TaxID=284811 RepID=Q75BE8_EREGS|nr:ADL384Wp [Eremothecium gossypii ATCC 10895]AAS51536.1 ADL384Wp [Eremothecium gossypii ATCC 10895]AEY95832.1 FADL384Wp [Eremothecium gossypii FDAG1]
MSTAELDASKLKVIRKEEPTVFEQNADFTFGRLFIDHMLVVEWKRESGWQAPEIRPYGNLSLDPSACVFHYGFELFEGMKAYRTEDGRVTLFRPEMNAARMNRSAARIGLPQFDAEQLVELIGKLVELDRQFVPQRPGYSLYIRPVMIGTSASLGVTAPDSALLYVIACPVGPYYKSGFSAVRLLATDNVTRAWPGGFGDKKLGGNYAPCIPSQEEAARLGYHQNLWLFGPEKYITEVGTMNAFFVFKDSTTGKKELVTAPLDGTILEGVTRDSVLTLARERLSPEEWDVSERYYTISEVAERAAKGEVVEAFGCGTAVVVSPIKEIGWNDQAIKIPLLPGEETGEFTKQVAHWISEIQYGKVEYNNWSRTIADLK